MPLLVNEEGHNGFRGYRASLIFALRQDLAPDVLSDRLLWFRRAFPSTTLDKQVFYEIVLTGYGTDGLFVK